MSEFLWKRRDLLQTDGAKKSEANNSHVKTSRVLVIYTGGTIGMKLTNSGIVTRCGLSRDNSETRVFLQFHIVHYHQEPVRERSV